MDKGKLLKELKDREEWLNCLYAAEKVDTKALEYLSRRCEVERWIERIERGNYDEST